MRRRVLPRMIICKQYSLITWRSLLWSNSRKKLLCVYNLSTLEKKHNSQKAHAYGFDCKNITQNIIQATKFSQIKVKNSSEDHLESLKCGFGGLSSSSALFCTATSLILRSASTKTQSFSTLSCSIPYHSFNPSHADLDQMWDHL